MKFAGFQEDPGPFYDAMDIFANAVPVGSGSLALMEAMARGIPGIITFAGPDEAVVDGQTGFNAPPNDPEALALAIERLVASPDRAQMGAAAARHVAESFSMRRVADDLLSLYACLLGGSVTDFGAELPHVRCATRRGN